MRIQRQDDDDIRELMEHGSSSWVGPSPSASQSRWAAPAGPHRVVHVARLGALVVGFTVVVFGLTLLAASQSPSGAAATVVQLVSHAFPETPGTPGVISSESPSAPVPASPGPGATGQPAAARPAATPTPSPARRTEQEDRPPSPSGTPRPSPSPDE